MHYVDYDGHADDDDDDDDDNDDDDGDDDNDDDDDEQLVSEPKATTLCIHCSALCLLARRPCMKTRLLSLTEFNAL